MSWLNYIDCFSIGKLPNSPCTFEQPDVCSESFLQHVACPTAIGNSIAYSKTVITNGEVLSRGPQWITVDHTYGNKYGKYLIFASF